MKRYVQMWTVPLVALMTLAVIFVWSPLWSQSASSPVHAAVISYHGQHEHAEQKGPQRPSHSALDEDCQASAIGCCMMTHCHPGISVDAHEMTRVMARDETTAARPQRVLGSGPRLILPPPRRPWL